MQPKFEKISKLFVSLIVLLAVTRADGRAESSQLDPAMEKQAAAIFDNTLSPFCPGRLLRDCPSSAATELKEEIRQRLQKGEGPEQILESLFAQYGDQVRAAPPGSGFGLLAWSVPFLFLGIGLVFTILWLNSKRRAELPDTPAESDQLDSETRRKIESELSKM